MEDTLVEEVEIFQARALAALIFTSRLSFSFAIRSISLHIRQVFGHKTGQYGMDLARQCGNTAMEVLEGKDYLGNK